MKNLKNFKQFEAFVDKDKNLQDMDWEGPKKPSVDKDGNLENMDSEQKERFIELADLGLKTEKFLDDDTYLSLPLEYKEIYTKMTIEEKAIFFHQPIFVQELIKNYPEECKVCIEKNILETTTLPYSFEIIDILPIEYQKLIVSLIIHNFEKYKIKEIQYDSFDIKVQKIIDFNKNKIIIIWKK